MALQEKDILHAATLSKLNIKPEEIEGLTRDMNQIVNFVEKINEVDTKNISPLDSVQGLSNAFRADIPGDSLSVDFTENIAPKFEDGHIVVPPVIE